MKRVFLEGFQATKDGHQCSSEVHVLRAKQQADLPLDEPLSSLAAQDGRLTPGVAREGAVNGQGCTMLAQGTACNRATFFGNASQVSDLQDEYLKALARDYSSIYVPSSLYRTGHHGAITLISCPEASMSALKLRWISLKWFEPLMMLLEAGHMDSCSRI